MFTVKVGDIYCLDWYMYCQAEQLGELTLHLIALVECLQHETWLYITQQLSVSLSPCQGEKVLSCKYLSVLSSS